jgi:hypothetical protein
MVHGDHGNSAEENNSGGSVEEVSPTQNDINDEDFCEPTQQEIQSAELRYSGSLLQESIWQDTLKLPLPTAAEREVSVLFGRQEKDGPAHGIFVKLYNQSRNSKQPASRHHSLLRLNLDKSGQLSASLQDLHSYSTRFTVIIEPTGQSIHVNNSNPSSLCNGSTLHFCPLVPRLPQEDCYEEYTGFNFSLPCGLLSPPKLSKTGGIVEERVLVPASANQTKLRLVVTSSLIGGLMGTGGSTTHRLQQDYQSSIKVSEPRLFFFQTPQRSMDELSIAQHVIMLRCVVQQSPLYRPFFFSFQGSRESFNLYFVIPAVSARLLAMGAGQVLAHLTSAHKTEFRLRDPHRLAPSERLLAATGPISVLPEML